MSESLEAEIRQLYEDWIANPSPVVCARLADRLRVAGRNDEALEVSRRGKAEWPANVSIRVVIARCLRGTGDTEGARSTFEEVLKADPFNLVALKNLAEISVADGRFNDALKYYGDYLFENPGDNEAEQKFHEAKGLAASAASLPPAYRPPLEAEPSEPVLEAPPVVEHEPSPAVQAAPVPEAAQAETAPSVHEPIPPEEPAAEQTQAAPVTETPEPEPAVQADSVLESSFSEQEPAVQAAPVMETPSYEPAAEETPVSPEPTSARAETEASHAPDHEEAPVEPASPAVEAAPEDVFGQTPDGQGTSGQEVVRESSGASPEDAAAEAVTEEDSLQASEEDRPVSFPKTGRMEKILKEQGVAPAPPLDATSAAGSGAATVPAEEADTARNLRREPRSLIDLFSPEERSELFLEPYRQEEK